MSWYGDHLEEDYFLLEEPSDLETIGHIAFLRSFLDIPAGAEILDLASGSGRLSIALSRLGYQVTAIDHKEHLIQHAQAAAARAEQKIDFVCEDMRNLAYNSRFDFVLSFLHSFGYLRDEENLGVLRSVRQALKPGGRVLIDLANRDSLLRDFEKHARRWIVKQSHYILFRREMDPLTGRLDSNVTIMKEGGLARNFTTSVRYYVYPEIKFLLQQAHLSILEVYGTYERVPYSFGSPRMIILAERQE